MLFFTLFSLFHILYDHDLKEISYGVDMKWSRHTTSFPVRVLNEMNKNENESKLRQAEPTLTKANNVNWPTLTLINIFSIQMTVSVQTSSLSRVQIL